MIYKMKQIKNLNYFQNTENKPNITEEIFDGNQRFVINNKDQDGGKVDKDLSADASYPQQYYTGPGGATVHQVPELEQPGNYRHYNRHAIDTKGRWREGAKEKEIRD